jgi:hypothetical protein
MIQNPIRRKVRYRGKRFARVGAANDSKRFNPDPQLARTYTDLPERKHLIAWPFIGRNLPDIHFAGRGTGYKDRPASFVITTSALFSRLNLAGFALVASLIPSALSAYLYSGASGMSVRHCSQI